MSAVLISVKWTGSEEFFLVDLEKLERKQQIAWTTESSPGYKPYQYRTSSTFEPTSDGSGGGVLTVRYREKDNPHLKQLGCRWGETILVLNRSMRRGTADWIDSAEMNVRKKVYSTTPEDHAEWRRVPPLAFDEVRKTESVKRAQRAQQRFRDRLLLIDPKCAITGEQQPELLEAAHVVPVAKGGCEIESNGVLLRVDLHRLFDSKLVSIEADGRVTLSNKLASTEYRRLLANARIETATFDRIKDGLSLPRRSRRKRKN